MERTNQLWQTHHGLGIWNKKQRPGQWNTIDYEARSGQNDLVARDRLPHEGTLQ